jgi:hypothetical protein
VQTDLGEEMLCTLAPNAPTPLHLLAQDFGFKHGGDVLLRLRIAAGKHGVELVGCNYRGDRCIVPGPDSAARLAQAGGRYWLRRYKE